MESEHFSFNVEMRIKFAVDYLNDRRYFDFVRQFDLKHYKRNYESWVKPMSWEAGDPPEWTDFVERHPPYYLNYAALVLVSKGCPSYPEFIERFGKILTRARGRRDAPLIES